MRQERLVGCLAAAAAAIAVAGVATEGDARACGGCFSPPTQDVSVVTDHRMIFAISQQQTTLYDEIEYSGSPASFAWVLPIQGPVTVGLSADTLFSAFDQATQTTVIGPSPTVCPFCGCGDFAGATAGSSSGGGGSGSVTILGQAIVGPYETVQLQSSDPNALNAWLTTNGFAIPANVTPIIDAYVNEGFDFLALKLVPGAGVQAMRPISVTSPGASLSLPLRMVAAGTGATVGITLWVVADGRYEPKNFSQFVISPSDLVWDFSTSLSNYTTLQQQEEIALGNAAWQIESSLTISPYSIENAVLSSTSTTGGYAAIPTSDAGAGDAGPSSGESVDSVRQNDLATVFAAGPGPTRITRMRADLSQAALANDLVLQAAADQSTLSNIYTVTKSINDVTCPEVDPTTCGCSGFGGDGAGDGGVDDGGTDGDQPGSLGKGSSGCAVGPGGQAGSDVGFALTGLVGIALVRARRRTPKKRD
jgi:MYXO-CTERM domain-containing protein